MSLPQRLRGDRTDFPEGGQRKYAQRSLDQKGWPNFKAAEVYKMVVI
jgi:hypothetical protein